MVDGGAVGGERISFGAHAYQSTLEHAAPVGCHSGSGQEFPGREITNQSHRRVFLKLKPRVLRLSTVDCELRVRESYLRFVCLLYLRMRSCPSSNNTRLN